MIVIKSVIFWFTAKPSFGKGLVGYGRNKPSYLYRIGFISFKTNFR